MSTVLWGGRAGDVQYNSLQYWRRTIPIGDRIVHVDSTSMFMPGSLVDTLMSGAPVETLRVSGVDPDGRAVGVRPL